MKTRSKFTDWTQRAKTAAAAPPGRCRYSFRDWFPSAPALVLATAWGLSVSPLLGQRNDVLPPASRLGPGAVGLVPDDTPAEIGFGHAEGRIESAGDGAASAVRAVLNTPDLGHAWITAGAGVVEFVFAPIAAGYGALSSARERLPQDKLAETESELAEAMKRLAAQEYLHELLMQTTNQIGRPVVVIEPKASVLPGGESVCARLEARVERLRLERADRRGRFALCMTARVRLVDASDGTLIYDRFYPYRSDKALFVDWARQGGFESVARTGFRDLAERIGRDVASCSAEAPVLLGAGHTGGARPEAAGVPRLPLEPEEPQIAFVSFRRGMIADRGTPLSARLNDSGPAVRKLVQVADYHPDALSFEIQSTGKAGFRLQLPLTRAQATVEAQSDTEWALDGLENDRNFVVQAGAAIAAIPVGIAEQSAAIWHGLSRRRLAIARNSLGAVTNYARPQEAIALQLARNLTPRNADRILPAMAISRTRPERSAALNRGPSRILAMAGPSDTVLEIRVLRADLSGKEGINPPLALNIKARASVIRTADGVEVCSIPVFYRSRERRFCAWAAHNAQAFRQELDYCYRQIGQALASEIASRGLAPSSQNTVFASNY